MNSKEAGPSVIVNLYLLNTIYFFTGLLESANLLEVEIAICH